MDTRVLFEAGIDFLNIMWASFFRGLSGLEGIDADLLTFGQNLFDIKELVIRFCSQSQSQNCRSGHYYIVVLYNLLKLLCLNA